MSIRQRRIESDYLKVNGEFMLMMSQFTALDEKPGAKTTTKRYIGDASSTTTITSYESSSDFEGDQIVNDEVVEYMVSIGKLRKTGADSQTELCQVELDKPGIEANTFYCRKSNVSIQVDEFPNNDGEFGLKGSLNYLGDPVEGTFNTQTKKFEEGFTEKTIEVSYTATGAITEISLKNVTYDTSEHKFKNVPYDTTTFTFKDDSTLKTATLTNSWDIK